MDAERRQRVRQIFMEIAELPEGERAGAIGLACGSDGALRGEVERLLSADRDAGGFMSAPTGSVQSPSAFAPITERAGSRVGPYKLLQMIGEGGFGAVFLAEQDVPVRRRVALKIIKLGMDTKSVVARFEAERQALALMDHPNIARVLDAGATDTGRPYFVMEYVKGDPITTFADARALSLKDRLVLFAQVCQAVQHAHTKGVIHRDIKPANVLVSMIDGKPFAKVIDFGIAKSLAARLTEKTLFTEHRQLIGTLEYMSPEQAEGSLDIDTRTDVYALGVLLYELLTGATPFDGLRLRSAAFLEMQRIIKEEEPPSPSVRVTHRMARPSRGMADVGGGADAALASEAVVGVGASSSPSDLRGELDWIVMKALDKDRARRYETPSQLAQDVERHLAGEAVVAAPPTMGYRMRKFVRRNRGAVAAGGAVAAVLLVGIAGTSYGLWRAEQANEELSEVQEFSTGLMRDFMIEQGWFQSLPDSTGAHVTELDSERIGYQFRTMNTGTSSSSVVFTPLQGQSETDLRRGLVYHFYVFASDGYERLEQEKQIAEWSAYTANLALAQAAMDAGNWPEARERIAACPESKRGWEWKWLAKKAESVIAEFRGGWITLSPDRKHVFMSAENTARVYAIDGSPTSGIIQTPGMTFNSEFSDDGFRIITQWTNGVGSADGSIFERVVLGLDGAAIGRPIIHGFLRAPYGFNYGLQRTPHAINRDGSLVATSDGAELRLWTAAGERIGEPIMHPESVTSVVFSPTSKAVLTVCSDHVARLWSLDGTPIGSPMAHEAEISSALFSHDGQRILTASEDKTARLWDLEGHPVGVVMTHQASVHFAAFDRHNQRIVTESLGHAASLWDLTGKLIAVIPNRRMSWTDGVLNIAVNDTCETIVSQLGAHSVQVVNCFGQSIGSPVWHIKDIVSTSLSADAASVAIAVSRRSNNGVCIHDVSGSLLEAIQLERYCYRCELVGGDDRLLTWELLDDFETVSVRSLPLAEVVHTIGRDDNAALRAAVELDGLTTPVLHQDVVDFAGFDSDATAAAVLSDGSRLVTGDDDGTVRFWDPATKQELASIRLGTGVTRLTFTSDATRLVVELTDGSARILDTRSGEEQSAELQRRWAERIPVAEYLDPMWASGMPVSALHEKVINEESLTPLRRLVATELLAERVQMVWVEAEDAFHTLTKAQSDKAAVLAAARAADLPVRVKDALITRIEEWTPKPAAP